MSKRSAASRFSALTSKKIRTRPITSSALEENVPDEFEPTFNIELPTVTELRLLQVRLLFPKEKFKTKVPPLIFVHQLYDDRPLVEAIVQKDIEEMAHSGKIMMMALGSDSGIVFTEDMNEYISTLDIDKKIRDRVRVVWKDNTTKSIEKSVLKMKYKLTDNDISEFIRSGFLVIMSETTYSFSFPGMGEFMKAIYTGRRAILAAIEKSKYKELLISEIERRPFEKTVKLGVKYQLADIIGGKFVTCLETTSGTLLKHIPKEKKRR